MTLHPEALDRIIPVDPCEAVRARYADLACEDRPGDPWAEPFDARDQPQPMLWAVVAVLIIGGCFVSAATGIVL